MKPSDFRFSHPLRVRWAEVDIQKIVFNAHYLMYLDTAMADYWRALALPYEAAMQRLDGEVFVRKAQIEFNASARMDDFLDVALRCDRIGTSSMTFVGAIFRGGQLLVTGELVYVFADATTLSARPVPPLLRQVLTDYEAGRPIVQVRTGDWAALRDDAAAVRTAVFVHEQGIGRDDEWDEHDATAIHAVVTNALGMPVATGRLLQESAGVSRIGRMAVDRNVRGAGLGRLVIDALHAAAQARGDTACVLSAQRSAEAFYRRLGYVPQGDPYEEVGIAHIAMTRRIA